MPERREQHGRGTGGTASGGHGPDLEGARWGALFPLGAALPRCTDLASGRREPVASWGQYPSHCPPRMGWALPMPPENHRPGRGQSRWEVGVQGQRTHGPQG